MTVIADRQDRPKGRSEVIGALKDATLELLGEKGVQFSVREAAERAGVNQGLIYRHFGSKEALITATTSDATAELSDRLRGGESAVDLLVAGRPDTAAILARLVLDESSQLITEHPVISQMVETARAEAPTNGPTAETRVAIANAAVLGWSLFGRYLSDTTGTDSETNGATLRTLVDQMLSGPWPD